VGPRLLSTLSGLTIDLVPVGV